MKAADLDRARELLDQIEADTKVGKKLRDGAPLRLTIGSGGDEQEIILSAGFRDELRQRLADALAARVNVARTDAAALGVEL